MRTVKEISEITGISVRTLHYYDEIGLLRPTSKSEAGYRLYDDKALETLQQILFFREFDISLSEIKKIMTDPLLDKNKILKTQKKMLAAEKERIERLISGIDDILKGENKMDFEIFDRSEIEQLFNAAFNNMPEYLREIAESEFGGAEAWKEHYIKAASTEKMQKGYQKMIEWYGGDKERALDFMTNPQSEEVVSAYIEREKQILRNLAALKSGGYSCDSFAVKQVIGEYGFVMKHFYQIKCENALMLSLAKLYRDEKQASYTDSIYGAGASAFFADAIEVFYKSSRI